MKFVGRQTLKNSPFSESSSQGFPAAVPLPSCANATRASTAMAARCVFRALAQHVDKRTGPACAAFGVARSSFRSFHRTPTTRGPIALHPELPCFDVLKKEGVWVVPAGAVRKDNTSTLAPVRVCVLNLMPLKESTELQLCRMLGRSAAAVEVTWCVPDNYSGKNSAPGYLDKFYKRFSQIKGDRFDGFIVTGAPIEHLPFEQVKYWAELQEFFEFIRAQDAGMLSLCWGAMASIYHFHGIPKHITGRKEFGVFQHQVVDASHPLAQALPHAVGIPASRHTTWKLADFEVAVKKSPQLQLVLNSSLVGPCLIWDDQLGHAHMINHFEYDADTLDGEYRRDKLKGTPTGEPIHVPHEYYPGAFRPYT